MAAKKPAEGVRPQSVVSLIETARHNPYLGRLLEDRAARRQLLGALATARAAYAKANGRGPARSLLRDRKLQRDLLLAAGALRDVAKAVRQEGEPERRPRKLLRRVAVAAGVGSVAALAASKTVRGKALDLLFGKEEEFSYNPPPTAPQPESRAGAGSGE